MRSVKYADGLDVVGWSTEHEMTKWHLKQARADGENFRYSMFDFARGYSIADDNDDADSKAQFRALWLTYREAFEGERQLFTRHKHFKIKELQLSDNELAEQELEEPIIKTVAHIDFEHWQVIVFMNARGTVLEQARRKGAEGVASALSAIVQGYLDFFPDNPCNFHIDKSDQTDERIDEMKVFLFVQSLLWRYD